MKSIYFILWISMLRFSTLVSSCGISNAHQAIKHRIVGGVDAGFGNFPWQAFIQISFPRNFSSSGGSLITHRHVVTVGHSVAHARPGQVRVTLGEYDIHSAAEPLPAYTFGVMSIMIHPYYKFIPRLPARFDVAILLLDKNVNYMPHIAPICLPELGSDYLGEHALTAGWGRLNHSSELFPHKLQVVDVQVLGNRVCECWHREVGINIIIHPEMLCAGYKSGGKDSCDGDSGGPLMLERSGRWYLIGVVSTGYFCGAQGRPGIYHRVAQTVNWIRHATRQLALDSTMFAHAQNDDSHAIIQKRGTSLLNRFWSSAKSILSALAERLSLSISTINAYLVNIY